MNRILGKFSLLALAVVFLQCQAPAAVPPASQPAAESAATKPTGPTRYEKTIQGFEALDKRKPPAANPTLFVGSSSFTKWKALETEFTQFNAINRGFGGSTFPDLNYYFERVVVPYKPAKIVVFEGTNDAALHHSPEQIFGDAKAFAEMVRAKLPDAQLYFLPLIPAPVRKSVTKQMDDTNALIQDFVKTDPHFHYIDTRKLLLDEQGDADPKYYLKDRLHPNEEGYAKWIPVIKAALEAPLPAMPAGKP